MLTLQRLRPSFWNVAAAALLLGVPGMLAIRHRREAWLRMPRPIGESLRVIQPAWLTEVELMDQSRRGILSTSDPSIMRPCLAAAQRARWSSETGVYRDSEIIFRFRRPGGPEDRRILRVNTDAVRRDIGPAMAACVESLRRKGQTP